MSLKVGAQSSTFSHADSLLTNGRYRLALMNLKSIDTLEDVSNYKMGAIYASVDDLKNAIVYYKKSLSFKESNNVKKALAKAYHKTKQHKKAINIYELLFDDDPRNLIIQYQLGKLYFAINDLRKATKIFRILSEKDPKNPNYHYQLGLISARRLDGNGMLDNFLNAYKTDNTHIKSVYQLAKTFAQLRKLDSSRLFTDKGLLLDSLHINLNKLKINEHFRNKEFNLAISKLQLLDSVSPSDLYTKKMLGRSYFNIDSLDLAAKNFNSARALDKEDFKILTYLGHIYKSKKEYRKAFISYMRATSVGYKERSEEYYGLGMLYLERKEYIPAIGMLKKSFKENKKKNKVLYQLALTSDSYYKDKKIAYNLYDDYIMRFEEKDKDLTAFVLNRMKEIKKELFMKGEKVE